MDRDIITNLTGTEVVKKFHPITARMGAQRNKRSHNKWRHTSSKWKEIMNRKFIRNVTISPHYKESK